LAMGADVESGSELVSTPRKVGRAKFSFAPHRFLALQTRADVAAYLGITHRFLAWILYVKRERENYRIFTIPKKAGGVREIAAPPKNLAILQRKLAAILLANYRPKAAAHGFAAKRSIATNAMRHKQQRVVFNIDLEDFFPTIHLGRFRNLLMAPPFSIGKGAATAISQICFGASGRLPQGAPSSPIVSNYVCRSLDDSLQTLASKHGCRYTRYADDITFSTSRPSLPQEMIETDSEGGQVVVGAELQNVVQAEGFRINNRKVRVSAFDRRLEVTGLTVNEGVNVRRYTSKKSTP
jgi:RNA-directed DNA polymerase